MVGFDITNKRFGYLVALEGDIFIEGVVL